MEIPVYLVAGFLDAGKTDFINGVLEDGFADDEATLLIRCEQGENEYPDPLPRRLTVVDVENEEDLKCSLLKSLEKQYRPRQVLIEYNGMWSLPRLEQEVLPSNWILYQIMTIVQTSTFDAYARNMGQIMMEKLISADMIVFNRCTPELSAALRKRNLRMVNRRANIYLEYEDGSSEDYNTGAESPFDLSLPVIDIPDDDFGVFYVDAMENPQRYDGKTVHLKLVMCHIAKYPGLAAPGRFAMLCCENDISFLGMIAKGDGLDAYQTRDWVEVTAKMGVTHHELYGKKPGPLLNIQSIAPCEKPVNEVVTF
ncbi:MAG: GTP-binding protein [Candidatus Enterenecus sp.]